MTAILGHDAPYDSGVSRTQRNRAIRLIILAAVAAVCVAVFLTIGVTGNWDYILPRRTRTVATMAIVAIAIALATVLFHTVTANRILTPSIMGFDALYLLIQTSAFFLLGTTGALTSDPVLSFAGETLAMVAASVVLYRWLLVDTRRSLHLLILVGVVLGILLRSVSSLLQRIMAPDVFIVLQDQFFADFTSADPRLLVIGGVIIAVTAVLLFRVRRTLDVVALGREQATSLGVDHRRVVLWVLVGVAVLVAVATALVGPTLFFGLIVAHLAYRVMGTDQHVWTLPAASLCGLIALIGGQVIFERVLGFEGSLSIVVEFLGGIVFLVLLLRRAAS